MVRSKELGGQNQGIELALMFLIPIYLCWRGESLFHRPKNLIKIAGAEHMLNIDAFP